MLLQVSPILIWFLVGIVFFIIEITMPGFILFFFGLGAWLTALTIFFVDIDLATQLIVFITASVVCLLLLRVWVRNIFHGKTLLEEDSVNANPSVATGVVIEEICPPSRGRIKHGGSFWQAEADVLIKVNTVVKIVEQKNLLVKVRPLN
jgi:membrane protein implicated in regulation of membrane protease activity